MAGDGVFEDDSLAAIGPFEALFAAPEALLVLTFGGSCWSAPDVAGDGVFEDDSLAAKGLFEALLAALEELFCDVISQR